VDNAGADGEEGEEETPVGLCFLSACRLDLPAGEEGGESRQAEGERHEADEDGAMRSLPRPDLCRSTSLHLRMGFTVVIKMVDADCAVVVRPFHGPITRPRIVGASQECTTSHRCRFWRGTSNWNTSNEQF
jgi:hypothetical protein